MILKRNGTWKCLSVVTLRAGVSRFSGRKFPVKDGCRFSNWRKSTRCCFVAAASASPVAPPLARNPPHGAAAPLVRRTVQTRARRAASCEGCSSSFVASSLLPTPPLLSFASASPRHDYVRQPRQLGRLHRRLCRSVRGAGFRGPSARPNSENGNDGWHGLRVSMRASQRTRVLPDASRKPLPRPGPFSHEKCLSSFQGYFHRTALEL